MGVHGGITDRIVDPGKVGTTFQERAKRQFADAAKAIEREGCHVADPGKKSGWMRSDKIAFDFLNPVS